MQSNANGHDDDDTESDCAQKFRKMLGCVERSGAVAACNSEINRFLACERAVFRSALNSAPPSPASPRPSRTVTGDDSDSAKLRKPSSGTGTGGDVVETTKDLVVRAIGKEWTGCQIVVDTLTKASPSEYARRIKHFDARILENVQESMSILSTKVGKVVRRTFGSPSHDDEEDD